MRKKGSRLFTDVDRQILYYAQRYRYVRSTALQTAIRASDRTIKHHVTCLVRDKHLAVVNYQEQKRYPSEASILEITEAGEQYYLDNVGDVVHEVTNLLRQRGYNKNLPHSLGICETFQSIESQLHGTGIIMRAQNEILGRNRIKFTPDKVRRTVLDLPVEYEWLGRKRKKCIRPDGLISLQYGDQVAHFFLEYERGNAVTRNTEAGNSSAEKMAMYVAMKEQGIHKECLGINGFTVLFVYTSPGSMKAPVDYIAETYGQSHLFLVNWLPSLRHLQDKGRLRPELISGDWHRGGLPPTHIYNLDFLPT